MMHAYGGAVRVDMGTRIRFLAFSNFSANAGPTFSFGPYSTLNRAYDLRSPVPLRTRVARASCFDAPVGSHRLPSAPIGQNAQIVAGSQNWNTRVQGVTPAMQAIGNWSMAEGAWYTDADEQSESAVAVIGQTLVDNLFTPTGTDPLGQNILIASQTFRVVGTLQQKGAVGAANQDDIVFMPFATARARLNNSQFVNQIQVQVDSADNVADTQAAIAQLLEQRHSLPTDGSADDFTVRSSTQFVQTAQQAEQTLTLLLVGIAAISLAVAGSAS